MLNINRFCITISIVFTCLSFHRNARAPSFNPGNHLATCPSCLFCVHKEIWEQCMVGVDENGHPGECDHNKSNLGLLRYNFDQSEWERVGSSETGLSRPWYARMVVHSTTTPNTLWKMNIQYKEQRNFLLIKNTMTFHPSIKNDGSVVNAELMLMILFNTIAQ